jgi:hypothetical protein
VKGIIEGNLTNDRETLNANWSDNQGQQGNLSLLVGTDKKSFSGLYNINRPSGDGETIAGFFDEGNMWKATKDR